jgi:uncharacterized cupin superfamily protein
MSRVKPAVVLRAAELARHAYTVRHHWRARSHVRLVALSRIAKLTQSGVKLGTLAPGDSSYAYHAHRSEEEWLYLLSGEPVMVIDGAEVALHPGDFVAFPAPSVPHVLTNPGSTDAVYLMGGTDEPYTVVDYPERGCSALLMQDAEGRLAFYELGPAQYPFDVHSES